MNYLEELYKLESEYFTKFQHDQRESRYIGKRHTDYLKNYIGNNLDRVCNIEDIHVDSGVYLIEDFYIGKSKNIENRIAEHLAESLLNPTRLPKNDWDSSLNREKLHKIREVLKVKKLNITILSENTADETKLIKEGYKIYNLTNKTCR
jgi:predicted GIY-YIG superfamily endonuclease